MILDYWRYTWINTLFWVKFLIQKYEFYVNGTIKNLKLSYKYKENYKLTWT